ncbi:MAG: AmmeMemoRadiSam system protein B [Desulfocapsaceae bacterium]|nr:AmmeMemoRadiSam system protein B [Desulfocapsaceae bacterium]
MARLPAVAGRFYPADPSELAREVRRLIGTPPADRQKALALICPHAGYMYSGGLAAETIRQVIIPETVIILGPNHYGQGAAVALSTAVWKMPAGDVPIDMDMARAIMAALPAAKHDETAHRLEHSLEVQIPFLQEMQNNLTIVPVVLSALSYPQCEEIAAALADCIQQSGRDVLILASSDMTHYESRQVATRKDSLALDRLLNLDAAGLYQTVINEKISMCGFIPATIATLASLRCGARQARLVRYTDSGEASGDTAQVVGYAGLILL